MIAMSEAEEKKLQIRQSLFAAFGFSESTADRYYEELKDIRNVDTLCNVIHKLGSRKRGNENLKITTDLIRDSFFNLFRDFERKSNECWDCEGSGYLAAVYDYSTNKLVSPGVDPFPTMDLVKVNLDCYCVARTTKEKPEQTEDHQTRKKRVEKYSWGKASSDNDRVYNFIERCRYLFLNQEENFFV